MSDFKTEFETNLPQDLIDKGFNMVLEYYVKKPDGSWEDHGTIAYKKGNTWMQLNEDGSYSKVVGWPQ